MNNRHPWPLKKSKSRGPFGATSYMKFKGVEITEILRRIWLFSANKIKIC
jgi:hypothetical protein